MENNNQTKKNILVVEELKKYFTLQTNLFGQPTQRLRAVDNVSFELEEGTTIGVVGESGCGKTTLGRTILKLYDTTGGKSIYNDKKLVEVQPKYFMKTIRFLSVYNRIYKFYLGQIEKIKANKAQFLETFTSVEANRSINLNLFELDSLDKIETAKSNLKEEAFDLIQEKKKVLEAKTPEAKAEYSEFKKATMTLLKSKLSILDFNEKIIINQNKIDNLLESVSEIVGGLFLYENDLKELSKILLEQASLVKSNLKLKSKSTNLLNKLENETDQVKKDTLTTSIDETNSSIESNNEKLKELDKLIEAMKSSIKKTDLFNKLEANKQVGLNLARLTVKEMKPLRVDIQLIFQDPYSSLPPRMTVGSIIEEAVKVHHIVPRGQVRKYVLDVMKKCGLQPQYYDRYAHEFSGGQRQRICIARALAVNPRLVVCDEPVSALDVSIQAQIINLLKELQNNLGLTYIFISHDLSVVKYITNQIMVMYLGNVMEIGKTEDIFANPLHPYTQALFSAVPVPNPEEKMNRIVLKGDIPSPANPPKGCKFHTRCQNCMKVCEFLEPKTIKKENNHYVSCHLHDEEVMANLDRLEAEYKSSLIYNKKEDNSAKEE